jgi:serine/threonine protein kinase
MGEFKSSLRTWFIDIKNLKIKEMIASGSTCQVFKGLYMNIPVAIKRLMVNPRKKLDISDVKDNTPKFLKEFKREIGLLMSLPNHPNLLTLLGFAIDESDIYIVTEFCKGGTLFDLLYKKDTKINMSFKQQVKILMDICRGMQFLHNLHHPIIHRDLKSLNIFIDNSMDKGSTEFQTKIADFGLARTMDDSEEFYTRRMGTFHWMAPEIFADKPYNSKTDVYAFAIIMWEIFAQKTPYYNLGKPQKIFQYVYYKDQRPSFSDCNISETFKPKMTAIMSRNWDKNPNKRNEFEEIYKELEEVYMMI